MQAIFAGINSLPTGIKLCELNSRKVHAYQIFNLYVGNNIPQDILKAIGVAIKLNNDREAARHLENARTEKIMKQMERIELEKTVQVPHLV